MKKYIRNWIKIVVATSLCGAVWAAELPTRLSVGYLDYLPPVAYSTDDVPQGLAVDIFREASASMLVPIQWVPFQDHQSAIEALSKQQVDVLVGDFVHSRLYAPLGIAESMPFFVDEIAVASPRPQLSIENMIELAWTDLLQTTLYFSGVMAVICWLLMLAAEGRRNPKFVDKSWLERASILFFEVAACFLRDLLYAPVTNVGRILFSLWMFFSVVMVTIILSIITSTIVIISTDSDKVISSAYDLHLHHVGFLEGHEASRKAITMAGGLAKEYHLFDTLFAAFDQQGGIEHAAVGKTALDCYRQDHPEVLEHVSTSSIAIGYESWVFLYRANLDGAQKLEDAIGVFLEHGKQFAICQQYMRHPENCLVV
jgi:hypothetical protein